MRQIIKSIFVASQLSIALIALPAFADDAAEISKMLRAGQTNEALQRVDAALGAKPKDAHLRFLKGLILTEQNKNPEAISVFTKLTDDYPELPEPYNNLAVLYAAAGQYDKARSALEMAIRTNPTYGTAHENLGDIYAKLASQAYDKALQLDSGNSSAKLKLTLVRNLVGNTTGGSNPKAALAAATPAASTAANAGKPAATPPVVTAKTEPAKPEKAEKPEKADKAAETKVAAVNRDEDDVVKMVENWAKAWSNQDMSAYLGHYAKDFQTPKGESRKAWADERRSRIEGKDRITVKIESIKVAISGNTATAKFRQIYSSDRLSANSRKTLSLVKQDGKWQIKQERAGN